MLGQVFDDASKFLPTNIPRSICVPGIWQKPNFETPYPWWQHENKRFIYIVFWDAEMQKFHELTLASPCHCSRGELPVQMCLGILELETPILGSCLGWSFCWRKRCCLFFFPQLSCCWFGPRKGYKQICWSPHGHCIFTPCFAASNWEGRTIPAARNLPFCVSL